MNKFNSNKWYFFTEYIFLVEQLKEKLYTMIELSKNNFLLHQDKLNPKFIKKTVIPGESSIGFNLRQFTKVFILEIQPHHYFIVLSLNRKL